MVTSGFTNAYVFPAGVYDHHDHILHACTRCDIVPNLGLIEDRSYCEDDLRHTLLYSNETRGDVVYFDEFEELRNAHPDKLDSIDCITREDPSGICGARSGRIAKALLEEVAPDPSVVLAYRCGLEITPHKREAARAKGEDLEPHFVENMVACAQEYSLNNKQIK